MHTKRYNVGAWLLLDAPFDLRQEAERSGKKDFNEWYSDLKKAQERCEAIRKTGYFCWVYDTHDDMNVSPYLDEPLPMTLRKPSGFQ